jgi:hypothetical protein
MTSLLLTAALLAAPPTDLRPIMPWRGVHFLSGGADSLPRLERFVREVMPALDLNVLVLEVDYGFQWQSHPELRDDGALSFDQARHLAAVCRDQHIRLIPQFQCLGHQSWAKHTGILLRTHPEFDETPNLPLDNPGIYCRSWCPLHPGINKVIFALFDELLDAFQADALHVGMDEVFLIGEDSCPLCRGHDHAELFAKAVNDYHQHLVGEKKVEMLMWGDRLLDAKATGNSEWEASANGTAPAIDQIPNDIIVCDWHYGRRAEYPSIKVFLDKGFRVWPSGWRETAATLALIDDSARHADARMLGHLFTTWVGADEVCRAMLAGPNDPPAHGDAGKVAAAIHAGVKRLRGEN